MGAARLSNKLRVVLYGRFYPLRLNTDIPLCDGGRAMLQKPLDKGNIIAVCLVNLRGVPFAEAVCADTLIAQIIAHKAELLLYGPLGNGENQLVVADIVPQAIVFYVLLYDQRDGEHAALARLLLGDLQTVSVSIPDNITRAELQYIADAQSQISFQHKGGCNPLIGAAPAKALFHGPYNLFVLLCGERLCFLIHGGLHGQKFVFSSGKVRVCGAAAEMSRNCWVLVFVFLHLYEF